MRLLQMDNRFIADELALSLRAATELAIFERQLVSDARCEL